MAIFRITESSIEKVEETTFVREKLLERKDLQRRLKANISVLSPDLMVVDEEFGEWEDSSRRRIDLLCLDKDAHLVVVELKRTDEGGHMELQAVRYAAMVHFHLNNATSLTRGASCPTRTPRNSVPNF